MPNYYAHYVFGREVFAALPPQLQASLLGERAAFEAGLYGPDPLFCASPAAFHLALDMHNESLLPVAGRLVAAVRAGLPLARGYAAGFLCHFALDSRCHYYIEERRDKTGASHSGMELELDRALMLANGVDPLRETPLDRLDLPRGFLETVSAVYPGVSYAVFLQGHRIFRQLCRMQTWLAGTPAHLMSDWVGSRYPQLSAIKGVLLPPEPDPLYDQSTADLMALLTEEVKPTAQAIVRFFAVVSGEGGLDSWFDRPFSGQWTAEQEMGIASGS